MTGFCMTEWLEKASEIRGLLGRERVRGGEERKVLLRVFLTVGLLMKIESNGIE